MDMVDSHILLLTFPGQGAVNPSLQLANQLVRMGFKVTLVTSLFAHRRFIKNFTTPEGLTFAPFSDGYDDGFKHKDGDKHGRFVDEFRIHGSLAISEVISASAKQGRPVTHLIYTMLQTWAAQLAHRLNIPSTPFWIQPAMVFDIFYYYFNDYGDVISKNSYDSIEMPGLPPLTSRDLPPFLVPSISTWFGDLILPLIKEQMEILDAQTNPLVLVNTFNTLEPEALRAVEKINLIGIGPLILGGDLFQTSRDYIEWLNSKPESSVIYVSFGTVAVLSEQQMEEIAGGLLESCRPFMWVVRETDNGERPEEKFSCKEELKEQGMIVPWCSQLEILSHPSVGCFVSHCGWNSTLENLVSGVPVVGFPQSMDQPTNAKLIEDVWKIGMRVTANEEGLVKSDEIKMCIEMVMGDGEKGQEMRRNAKKWKDLARVAVTESGSSDMNLKAFVKEVGDGHLVK